MIQILSTANIIWEIIFKKRNYVNRKVKILFFIANRNNSNCHTVEIIIFSFANVTFPSNRWLYNTKSHTTLARETIRNWRTHKIEPTRILFICVNSHTEILKQSKWEKQSTVSKFNFILETFVLFRAELFFLSSVLFPFPSVYREMSW